MNNNFVKFAFVGIACAAFCTATFAAPRGGHPGGGPGGNGRPTRAAQPARGAPASHAARPSTAHHAARPAARPSTGHHAAPARPATAWHGNARPEPRHHAPPPRVGRRHIPSHAHYWARPPVPAWRVGALRAWEWIEAAWTIVMDGVYYYGDGYYYDGYNYYYNGAYHTVPPVSIYI